MSLLDKGNITITVYPQEETTDADGNQLLRASTTGYEAQAVVQPARQSGTSARRAEQGNEGYETEEVYRVRFTRAHDREHDPLGMASEIEWNGERWHIVGWATEYSGSFKTAHIDYQMKRT